MNQAEHKARHQELHESLDELLADFLSAPGNRQKLPSTTTVMELMQWSAKQTNEPDSLPEEHGGVS